MRAVRGTGDSDDQEWKWDDAAQMQERRLEERVLGQMGQEKAWKRCVVAKNGAGDIATSSDAAEDLPHAFCSERFV